MRLTTEWLRFNGVELTARKDAEALFGDCNECSGEQAWSEMGYEADDLKEQYVALFELNMSELIAGMEQVK